MPSSAWRSLSAGRGAHGERFYDWTLTDIKETRPGSHALLIRRNHTTGELAFYRVWSPRPATLAQIVRVAGLRWNVEEDFQTSKELAALDEHQVRRWVSWHRWTILVMLAHAFLSVITAQQTPPQTSATAPLTPQSPTLIPLTRNEIRHLFVQLSQGIHHTVQHILHWSIWRRHHQAVARACLYRRQAQTE